MSETSSIQTNRNRKQYRTVKLIKQVRQVTFFKIKIDTFVGGNLSHFRCPACWVHVVEFLKLQASVLNRLSTIEITISGTF